MMIERLEEGVEDCIDPAIEGAMRKVRKMGSDEIQKRFVGFEYLSNEQREWSVKGAEEEFGGLAEGFAWVGLSRPLSQSLAGHPWECRSNGGAG